MTIAMYLGAVAADAIIALRPATTAGTYPRIAVLTSLVATAFASLLLSWAILRRPCRD